MVLLESWHFLILTILCLCLSLKTHQGWVTAGICAFPLDSHTQRELGCDTHILMAHHQADGSPWARLGGKHWHLHLNRAVSVPTQRAAYPPVVSLEQGKKGRDLLYFKGLFEVSPSSKAQLGICTGPLTPPIQYTSRSENILPGRRKKGHVLPAGTATMLNCISVLACWLLPGSEKDRTCISTSSKNLSDSKGLLACLLFWSLRAIKDILQLCFSCWTLPFASHALPRGPNPVLGNEKWFCSCFS